MRMSRRDHELGIESQLVADEAIELVQQSGADHILALAADDVEPPPGLRARVLALADPDRRFDGFAQRMAKLFDFSLERASELLSEIGESAGSWVEPGIPGVRLLHFEGGASAAGADCGLVEVQPGVTFPAHRHHGDEWCLYLQGSGQDSSGQVYQPGDFVHHGEGSHHSFTALDGESFVFAVVLHGGFHPESPPTDNA